MAELLLIAVGAATVNNFVLVRFLGLCPLLGVGSRLDSAAGMSLATGFVLTVTAGLSYLLDHWVLLPLDLGYLRIISFILLIAGTVQLAELVIRRRHALLHRLLGMYLPLITTNCAVLGVALLNTGTAASLAEALATGLGAGLGFALVMLLFASLRERLESSEVPHAFRGPAIALVTAGMMSLAFLGFAGLIRV
ncbi:MAG: electron transport complex subunit RsxA [Gammaproteobacteria bacterium]|nr:electron transport complex subunit RsxA [Gammaproteobacteria bacterium]